MYLYIARLALSVFYLGNFRMIRDIRPVFSRRKSIYGKQEGYVLLTMPDAFLTTYLNDAIKKLIKDVLKGTLSNRKETAFLLSQARQQRENAKKRSAHPNIPVFLIASITSACNLHCAGCYARATGMCGDEKPAGAEPMSVPEWENIFGQAEELGTSAPPRSGGGGGRAFLDHIPDIYERDADR